MSQPAKPRTLDELKDSGWQPLTIREELRKNLTVSLERGDRLFERITGYDHTVIPQVQNALLAGHDMILLGERGQGKTRLIRSLVSLLDAEIPIIKGSEVNDNPLAPISRYGQELFLEKAGKLEIDWLPRQRRYTEKLATPDTTAAELIGEIDPVKVAEGRYLSDELTIHFGLIPRSNRSIFAINELPDLSEKVQVALFNILEERDIQIKGYKVQLPLDMLVVATANPEDYTSRGRIITPLKDRYAAHINTHYPQDRQTELKVVAGEGVAHRRGGREVSIPPFLEQIVAEITFQARQSPAVNQASGVSVRMTIANMETLISNAEKRAIRQKSPLIAPRLSDLEALVASSEGKLELEYGADTQTPAQLVRELTGRAVAQLFTELLDARQLEGLLARFNQGWWVEISDEAPDSHYQKLAQELPELAGAIRALGAAERPEWLPAALELVLEGLHVTDRLSREARDGKLTFAGAPIPSTPSL